MKTRGHAGLIQVLGRTRKVFLPMGWQEGITKNPIIRLKELYNMKTNHTMLDKNLVKNNVITNFFYN